MYRIIRCSDGAVLYDVNSPDTCPMTEPRGTFEIGQAGSLQFSLVPAHPLYNGVEVMETYVSASKDNIEIFYGRVIDVNVEQTTGIKQVECAGALQFLEDGEISPIQAEEQQSSESSEEEQSQEKGVQMTAAAFFSRCISDFNADIGNDPRRKFYVGIVRQDKAGEIQTYNISSYTQAKSAIETNLISEYGGYLRARRGDQDKLYLDWLGTYDEPNTSPIRLRENVISQENAISANGLFTVIRPIGKDNLGLTPGTMVVDQTMVNKYGRIIKTVTFSYADTQELLTYAAQNYINDIAKGTSNIGTIKLIDMHFLDHTVPTIHLGSTYTNIAGFEGQAMVVAGMELNFASPADDSITLKNRRELEANQKDGTSGRGPLSKKIQEQDKGQKGFKNIWQHITEGEDWLRIAAEKVEINAQELKELVGTFERYAEESRQQFELQNETISGNTVKIDAIRGTGVLQNSDHITQVAGLFSSKYYIVRSTAGRNPHNAGWYEMHPYIATEEDVGTGVELFLTEQEALLGNAVNTQSGLIPGNTYQQMVPTSDTTAAAGKRYYSKTLGILDGASLSVTEDGVETNIGTLLKETSEGLGETQTTVSLIEGSALWTERNIITAVCGEYEVHEDAQGNKTLVIKAGGGLKIKKDGTEFGIYTEDKLNAGVVVGWINDPENENAILGSKVNINATQVTAGSYTNVEAWLKAQGLDINRIDGLITDKIWTADLTAIYAEISNIKADYLNADDVMSGNLQVGTLGAGSLECGPIDCEGISTPDIDCTDVNCTFINGYEPKDFLVSGDVSLDGKTLTLYNAAGQAVVSFNKAATAELSGSWSGTTFTVTATPSDSARPNIVQGKVWGEIVPVYGTTEYDDTTKNVSMDMIVYSENGGEAGSVILRQKVSISANQAWGYGYNAGAPVGGTAGGSIAFTVHEFTIKRADGTYTPVYIDVANIYTTARNGYTEGTFTSVTAREVLSKGGSEYYAKSATAKNDRGTGLTCVPVLDAGGTVYYKAGAAKEYYNKSIQGVTGRGNVIVPVQRERWGLNGPFIFQYQNLYDSKGKFLGSGYVGSAGAGQMYTLGQKYIDYDVGPTYANGVYDGQGATYPVQGSSAGTFSPIDTNNAIRLGTAGTYYPGDGGEFYPVTGSAIHLGHSGTFYTKDTDAD